jgi:shikimate kinase
LALTEEPQVIATGAGWAAEPGNLASVAGRAFVIHLEVTVAEAARRLGRATDRPLLAASPAGDLVARLERQLAERAASYHLADMEIAVGDASAEAVAAGVATIARQYAGW